VAPVHRGVRDVRPVPWSRIGGWLLTAGIIALIATLVPWLGDAVKEYREVVRADTTGHLENPPAGKTPRILFGGWSP
jgi:hypothetical protein